VLRMAQGFGVGGEWGGAVLMAIEHAPARSRGFYGSWPQVGVPAGLLLSTATFSMFSGLPEEQFLTWGWRVPFLLSVVLVGVGYVIRVNVLETPAFTKVKETRNEARLPIVEVVVRYPRAVLLAIGARLAENGAFYIYTVFSLVYATQHVGVNGSVVLRGILLASAGQFVAIPFFGAMSDRFGRRPVYLFGAVTTGLFAYPFFRLLDTGSTPLIWSALFIALVVTHASMYAPQAAFLAELFSARVRYSGASLGSQVASVLGGGLSPFIATALLKNYGSIAVALYVVGMAMVTIVAVLMAAETATSSAVETM
jgi:MHS family shikimate/dehydroshikimate transporter-like MFS transporter